MGDRTSVQIEIGGQLSRSQLEELVQVADRATQPHLTPHHHRQGSGQVHSCPSPQQHRDRYRGGAEMRADLQELGGGRGVIP